MDMEKLTIYQLKTISGGERVKVFFDRDDLRGLVDDLRGLVDVAKDPQHPRNCGCEFVTIPIDLAQPLIKKSNNKKRRSR
jgi:hypothetical protein